MSESYRSDRFWVLLTVLFLFATAVAVAKAVLGVPRPFVDVFLFKEAGARLALDGLFAVRNLPHMEHDQLTTYAYYVPLYPFFYGIWASIFGVNLPASIAFDQLIKFLRTALLLVWLWPQIAGMVQRRRGAGTILGLILGALCLLPFHSDRPDDLALAFGLLGLVLPSRFRGVSLGLVAATSPAAAVLFTMIYLCEVELVSQAGWLIMTSLLTFLLLLSPVVLTDPEAPARFWQQVPLSVRPLAGTDWRVFAKEWQKTFWYAGKELTAPILFFGVTFFALLFFQKLNPKQIRLGTIALSFAIVSTLIWHYQFRYLWFSYVLLLGVLLSSPVIFRHALFLLCLVPLVASFNEVKAIGQAMTDERNTRAEIERLVSEVDRRLLPESRLAVSADSYFFFRDKREIDLAHYVCRSLEKYDFIFLSRQTLNEEKIEPPCRGKRRYFEIAQDFDDLGVLFVRKATATTREIARLGKREASN